MRVGRNGQLYDTSGWHMKRKLQRPPPGESDVSSASDKLTHWFDKHQEAKLRAAPGCLLLLAPVLPLSGGFVASRE